MRFVSFKSLVLRCVGRGLRGICAVVEVSLPLSGVCDVRWFLLLRSTVVNVVLFELLWSLLECGCKAIPTFSGFSEKWHVG